MKFQALAIHADSWKLFEYERPDNWDNLESVEERCKIVLDAWSLGCWEEFGRKDWKEMLKEEFNEEEHNQAYLEEFKVCEDFIVGGEDLPIMFVAEPYRGEDVTIVFI